MLVNDSIKTNVQLQEDFSGDGEILLQPEHAPVKLRHPYQVLRTLPKDATPAQQDSAIQATFQPDEIHYSSRPDTLRLPGQPLGKSAKDVNIPQYYRESFFTADSLFHPELNGGRMGFSGDPLPYSPSSDNMLTGALLLCFAITMLVISRSLRFITMQVKTFIYQPREDSAVMKETANEVNYQVFLCLQAALLFALSFMFYAQDAISETYVVPSQYHLLAIYFFAILGFILVKELITRWVNWTFFNDFQIHLSNTTRLFLMSLESVLMLPAVFVYTYFGITPQSLLTYSVFVIVLVKILAFYKAFTIFFLKKGPFVQIFLYFCTLEVLPVAMLWQLLMFLGNILKVTY